MSAPGLTSAIRSEGFANLQLNAGIFVANFDCDAIADADHLKTAVRQLLAANDPSILGMTSGGGSFTASRELRQAKVDGLRYAFKGDKFVDSIDAQITSTQVEITSPNIQRLVSAAAATASGKTTVSIKTAIDTGADYLTNVCWIGDLAGGGLIVIVLENALNTEDFSLAFQDKAEGKMTFGFHAHQSDVLAYDTAPFRVIFFDEGAERGEAAGDPGALLRIEQAQPNTMFSGIQVDYAALRTGSGTPSPSNRRSFVMHIKPFSRCLMISGRNMAGHVKFNGRPEGVNMVGRSYPAGTYYVSFVYHHEGDTFRPFRLQFGGVDIVYETEPADGLVAVQSAVAVADFASVTFVHNDYGIRNQDVVGISDVFLTPADVAADYGTEYEAADVTVYDFAAIPQFPEAQDDSASGVLYDGVLDLFAGTLTVRAQRIESYAAADAGKIDAATRWLSDSAPDGTTGYPDAGSEVLYYPAAPAVRRITNALGMIRTAKSALTLAWVTDTAASVTVQYVAATA